MVGSRVESRVASRGLDPGLKQGLNQGLNQWLHRWLDSGLDPGLYDSKVRSMQACIVGGTNFRRSSNLGRWQDEARDREPELGCGSC